MSFPHGKVNPKTGKATPIPAIPTFVPTDQCTAFGFKNQSDYQKTQKDTLYPNPYSVHQYEGILKGDMMFRVKGENSGVFADLINQRAPVDVLRKKTHEEKIDAYIKKLEFVGFSNRKIDKPRDLPPEAEIGVYVDGTHTVINKGDKTIEHGDWLAVKVPRKVDNIRTVGGVEVIEKIPENIVKRRFVSQGRILPGEYGPALMK